MSKSNEPLINELDNKFRNYLEYDRLIEKQKVWLIRKEDDENFGGGRSSFVSNPTERQAIMFSDCEYIKEWEKLKDGVEITLNILGQTESELIKEKYWGACSWMTWKEFAKEKHYSPASMSRLKQKTLMTFGRIIKRIPEWN